MTENTEKSRLYISPSNAEDIASNLMMPQRTFRAFDSIDKVRRAFALPVSMGAPKDEREALDMAFDSAGGYSTIYESLQQHAGDMGQYPITSFIGYGALQQIAQNGMIRTCIQTVSDDIFRDWIELQGGKGDSDKRLGQLSDMLDQRKVKELFTKAAK